ncbi:carbamoyl-phosphate synthase (glutamine-hydrolyzing) cpa2 [Physocladia obscura]|uniref:Carbamoyl-phosphate synthase (Glutamine-hydrolyzing) cpa2 n=1 Tax=Physocladia obscura TaxID=109957 RepID=A0AAD5T965_9FUNG|nr:carbamoyl-phosphate synthase (glutamine-hydrolyzing) cpa2 [Physocladia obscura]
MPVCGYSQNRYIGHQLIRFNVSTDTQLKTLRSTVSWGYDIWTHSGITRGFIDVRVPANQVSTVATLAIPFEILVANIQGVVDKEHRHMRRYSIPLANQVNSKNPNISFASIFDDWQSYETLSAYISSLPGVTQLPSIGKTFLGQDTNAFMFGSGQYNVVMQGGIHAREWISHSTVTYVANQLATNHPNLLQQFTFYVIPVVNPDGYNYTRSPNGDRYHRKNMQPNNGTNCIGTDVNRNFNINWSGPGASSNPCDDDYYGTFPFSTPEAKNIRCWHSYSELFMFSNAYSCATQVKDFSTLNHAAQLAVEAIQKTHGHVFSYGAACPTIYEASGIASDYTYNILNITYSYSVELRPNSSDPAGFNPSTDNIVDSGEEITAAMVALWTYVGIQLSKSSNETYRSLLKKRR